MEEELFKPRHQIVEELIREYVNLWNKYDLLYEAGIQLENKFFKMDLLLEWALDLIGFPKDTSCEKDECINGKSFSREYLSNSTLLDAVSGCYKHDTVEEYIDFLYKEFEDLKKEEPQLFQ